MNSKDGAPADYYEPPKSRMAEAIQYPLDERWQARVLNAYRLDSRKALQSGDHK